MRVIAGLAKGRRLRAPRIPGIRPTSDKVKEALFSILADRVGNSRVLDLFGGTGAIGIEALSRGAREVEFVESDPAAIKVLHKNLEACDFTERAVVHCMDAYRFLKQAAGPYDLVFADPPYHWKQLKKLLPALSRGDIMGSGSFFVLEHFRKVPVPEGFGSLKGFRSYQYGDTVLTFYRKASSPQ